jgi:hypothetical protein
MARLSRAGRRRGKALDARKVARAYRKLTIFADIAGMFPGMFPRIRHWLPAAAALLACTVAAPPLHAQDGPELFSAETVTLAGDVRLGGADGEPSWIDGGYGKARFDGEGPDGDFHIRPWLAEADLVWQPRFTWSLTGTVVVTAQHGQDKPVDLSEAALTFKPLLGGNTKLSARAGLFWPPVSLEHSGPEWAVADTITPSAINSWIGDEVKVGAIETTVSTSLGSHRIALTAAAFGLNDTSGTLLAFRGWALHDQKATAWSLQPLPPLMGLMRFAQAPRTDPVTEIDDRVGWYARLGWSPTEAFELQAFHYDNRGDPEAVTPGKQWGWLTKFTNIGALLTLGQLELKAQAMGGRTEMGYRIAGRIWADTSFHSAFLLATRRFERGSVSARIEAFDTRSRGSVLGGVYSEDGWAFTMAAKRALGPRFTLLGEFLHVESDKPSRAGIGLAPKQRQNQFQLALRVRI